MKVFSMFSGIGGFEIPMIEQGWEIVGHSEIDKYANIIYDKHFKVKNYGDCRKINAVDLPDFDMLCGGFPCQSFSIAGKRGGIKYDTRGTLFKEIMRIAEVKRPGIIFLENVKGLLSSQEGWDFFVIQDSMVQLGYDIEWEVLNSKNFGVPQNRERVFIIGRLSGKESGQKIFPIGKDNKNNERMGKTTKGKQQGVRSNTITTTSGQWGNGNNVIIIHNMQPRNGDPKKGGTGHLTKQDGNTYAIDTGNSNAVEIKPVMTPNRTNKKQNSRRFKNNSEEMFTLTRQDVHGVKINELIRNLTPTECERLQGFPDNWTSDISDSQRYKCIGNAVTVNVIRAIVNKLTGTKP